MSGQILLLEPSGVMRRLLAEIARASGLQPVMSADGEDAIKKFQGAGSSLKLVFMEWHVPKKGALDLLKEFKGLRDVPVVIVTTDSHKEHVVAALKSGASGYVIKPFSVEQIKKKIEQFVRND